MYGCNVTECGPSGNAPSGNLAGEEPTVNGFNTGGGTNKHLFIIVHTTEGDSAAAAENALKTNGFSYHLLIEKSGAERRLLPDEVNARGAGGANTNSLQVSLVGRIGPSKGGDFDPKSPQLQTLSKRIAEWSKKFNIPVVKVVFTGEENTHGVIGHIDVTDPASEGHTDPGENFPWAQVLANAQAGGGIGGVGNGVSSGTTTDLGAGDDTDSTSSSSGSSSGSSDGCCSEGGSGGASTGEGGGCGEKEGNSQANKDQIWSYFMGKFQGEGYSKDEAEAATAGILGNWMHESGANPDRHNAPNPGGGCVGASGPVTGTVGLGIAQWCGSRQQDLKDFAGSDDRISCLGVQLEFAWKEMGEKNLIKGMKGQSPADAAHIFNLGGNGASGFEVGANDADRQKQAGEQYQAFTGKSPTGVGSGGAGAQCSDSSSVPSGDVVEAAKAMGEKGGCYEAAGGHGDTADLQKRIDNNFGPGYGVDCTGFVRAVLFVGTGKDPGSIPTGLLVNEEQAGRKGFERIENSKAQPGDVVLTDSHAEIITAVNPDGSFETVGSHTTGCSPDNGIYPAKFQGNGQYVLRYDPNKVAL